MDNTGTQKQIIIQMCECDMNISEVARKIYRHRNDVLYQMNKITRERGLNPRKFYDLLKLKQLVDDGKYV